MKLRQAQSGRNNLRQKSQLIHDSLCFQNLPIHSIYRKNPESLRFLTKG